MKSETLKTSIRFLLNCFGSCESLACSYELQNQFVKQTLPKYHADILVGMHIIFRSIWGTPDPPTTEAPLLQVFSIPVRSRLWIPGPRLSVLCQVGLSDVSAALGTLIESDAFISISSRLLAVY